MSQHLRRLHAIIGFIVALMVFGAPLLGAASAPSPPLRSTARFDQTALSSLLHPGVDDVVQAAAAAGISVLSTASETPFTPSLPDQFDAQGSDKHGNVVFASSVSMKIVVVAAQAVPTCGGKPATIWASGSITGTNGADVIVGSAGPDRISALMGDDIVCGNQGLDEIHGGKGNDLLYGGKDNDVLYGEIGRDTISCDLGTDDYGIGGPDADVIYSSCEHIGL